MKASKTLAEGGVRDGDGERDTADEAGGTMSRRRQRSERGGSAVCLAELSKWYGRDTCAVDQIDLTVGAGEFVTLLGPSGSGKTTSLMMVAGFVRPTSGKILVGNEDVTNLPAHKRNLGMVFQHYALFPHLTVAENIAFPLKMRRISKGDIVGRVQAALDLVDLPGYGSRYPRELSGGQQQRVALARALVYEPPVLLMDEPLGALDKQLRVRMQLEIKHIQRRLGVTVLYVTHDQEEALTMSDRVVVMRDGRIEQASPPETVYEEPANAFVANFLGESNIIQGTVRGCQNGQARIDAGIDTHFYADASDAPEAGTEVLASVRPEQMHIVKDGDTVPDGYENRWCCTVDEVIYVGDSVKYRLSQGGHMLVAKHQHGNTFRAAPGETVNVVWRAHKTRILRDRPGGRQ